MGKFINTEHRDMIDTLTKGVVKDMVKNPYYLFDCLDHSILQVAFYSHSLELLEIS